MLNQFITLFGNKFFPEISSNLGFDSKIWPVMPSINASLSSSFLKGGESFKKVLNSPISFWFNDKLFIDTPVLNLIPLDLFLLITFREFLMKFD